MLWCDKIAEGLSPDREYIINDSKTPSGRVHVGALRGVLIHDAMFRALRKRDIPVRYWFGVDDYDPVDEIPYGEREHFEKYLGQPLCNVPPPPESDAPDMAEHFIREFFAIFEELGVATEHYRMRDVYRSGRFNEAIDTILSHADGVREVYRKVSKSEKGPTWFPFQAVCENCGRVGTTEVTAYENGEVVYQCRPDLVTWATGCGHRGKVSPFDGNGKLPWKLEWVAKWHTFPVGIEGAGKDHSTKGGSRDVAAACLRRIFREEPPVNIPYEFFLVGGAKMSSSKGIGASARQMADFLPPEMLRFLMLRTQPQRPVNFSPDEKYIIKLFNDFDRLQQRVYHDSMLKPEDRTVYELSRLDDPGEMFVANFQLVVTLVQMPHLDLVAEVAKAKGAPLTDAELRHLEQRANAARVWAEQYAEDDEKTVLQQSLPARATALTVVQRAFLHRLADALKTASWDAESLQACLFDTSRTTPIRQGDAFQAVYRVLLDRADGPKAGNLLAVLEREFVIARCRELPFDRLEFLHASAVPAETFEKWLAKNAAKCTRLQTRTVTQERFDGTMVECLADVDGKRHLHRIACSPDDAPVHVAAWNRIGAAPGPDPA